MTHLLASHLFEFVELTGWVLREWSVSVRVCGVYL